MPERKPPPSSSKLRCTSNQKRIDSSESWDQLRARIAETPSTAEARGMFLSELVRSAPQVAPKGRRYVAFGLYPVREYMELILQVAQARSDKSPPATAVLRTGLGVYELFANSLVGTAIFSIARDFRRVVEVAPKGYAVSLPDSRVDVLRLEPGAALVRLANIWPFPDIFQAGIWLGAMEKMGAEGEIEVTRHSLSDVEFDMRWSESR